MTSIKKRSSICILNQHGERVRAQTVIGPWARLFEVLKTLTEPFAACYEASIGYGFLYEQIGAVARSVTVAHPGQLRLIFRSKKKNDRVDAEKLAKLLYLGEVPTVHMPSLDVRSWRSIVERRQRLVAKRTRCKNSLRALLKSHGIVPPRGLWSRKGLAWLQALELPTDADRLRRDLSLEELREFTAKVARVEEHLATDASCHAGVALLQTIPGVGVRTARP